MYTHIYRYICVYIYIYIGIPFHARHRKYAQSPLAKAPALSMSLLRQS